jgi:glycosyltransferase 2 family protein
MLQSKSLKRPSNFWHILKSRWLIRLLGTALLLFFLWRLNLNLGQIVQGIFSAALLPLLISIVLIFPILALKTWRWQILLKDLGIAVSFREAHSLYALGISAGSFTPGQSGDLIKAVYLNNWGHSAGNSLLSVILDRLFDVGVLLLLAVGGLCFLGAGFSGELPVYLVLLLGVAAAVLVLAVAKWRNLLLKPVYFLVKRKKARFNAANDPLINNQAIKSSSLLGAFLITWGTAALATSRVWFLALAINLNLSFVEIIAVSSLATAAALIPISVAGIGTRDFTLVGILGKLGYAAEKAVSLSALVLLLNAFNLVAGYVVWLLQKPSAPRAVEKTVSDPN